MKKNPSKSKPLLELVILKKESQKTTEKSGAFGKFKYSKPRNTNHSKVGPSWGGRKGN